MVTPNLPDTVTQSRDVVAQQWTRKLAENGSSLSDMLPKAWIQLISHDGETINLTAVSHFLKKSRRSDTLAWSYSHAKIWQERSLLWGKLYRKSCSIIAVYFSCIFEKCWTLFSRVGSTILTKHLTQQRCFCQYTLYCQLPLVGTFPTGK